MPAEVYELIAEVAGTLHLRECDVVSRLCPLLECRRGRGFGGEVRDVLRALRLVVGSEKAGSRELVYKPSYLISRLLDAPADDADFYVVLALYGEYVANQLHNHVRSVRRASLPDLFGFANHEFVINLARELGFNDVVELSRFLKALLDDGLVFIDVVAGVKGVGK